MAYPEPLPFEPGHPFWIDLRNPRVLLDSVYGETVDFRDAFCDPGKNVRNMTWRRALASMDWQDQALKNQYLKKVCDYVMENAANLVEMLSLD